MNSKDNPSTKSKSSSESTEMNRLNDLDQKTLNSLEGMTELDRKSMGSETSKSTKSQYSEDTSDDRPRHDALIRKALENPIVAKEFFEMHLPLKIKAMFSSHKMETESFVESDLKASISDILFSAKFKNDTGIFGFY